MSQDELTVTQQIERHITAHPRCTVADIMVALDIGRNTVGTAVARLRQAGQVRRVFEKPENGQPIVRWEPGAEDGFADDEDDQRDGWPKRATVSSWPLHMVRDPLVAALFVGQEKLTNPL